MAGVVDIDIVATQGWIRDDALEMVGASVPELTNTGEIEQIAVTGKGPPMPPYPTDLIVLGGGTIAQGGIAFQN